MQLNIDIIDQNISALASNVSKELILDIDSSISLLEFSAWKILKDKNIKDKICRNIYKYNK